MHQPLKAFHWLASVLVGLLIGMQAPGKRECTCQRNHPLHKWLSTSDL